VTFQIVPANLAVKAMRDSGYKNAAYALAELIDNSIQAGAKTVSLLCAEEPSVVTVRQRMQISEIAVLDDGSGMDVKTLRSALQFGNGAYLADRSGIGRFGMGLPNSSLSQASRVEVYTWTQGSRANFTYLDVGEINRCELTEVPEPIARSVPQMWVTAAGGLPSSGTLVVWKSLDKCKWRTARAIIENSELLIGRIYRRFIASGRAAIRLRTFEAASPRTLIIDRLALPNDPLYLMAHTSCPPPWDDSPMFQDYGEPIKLPVAIADRHAEVIIRFSIAKPTARSGIAAGSREHGQHAKQNVGVSIMRADRELELQLGWTSPSEPRDRWWGAEVEFPPELDEVFGVTNNKQSAQALSDIATLGVDDLATREGYESHNELQTVWDEERDPRAVLLRIKVYVDKNLAAIRKQLKAQTARDDDAPGQRHDVDSAEARGTQAIRQRQRDGLRGASDSAETLPSEQRKQDIVQDLESSGLETAEATDRAVRLLRDQSKFEFVKADIESPAFFTVRSKGGVILINLNTSHPAYDHLVELLSQDTDDSDLESLKSRVTKSYRGLKLLLEAWARYEDELPEQLKDKASQARQDWGRVARQFLAGE